MKTKISTRKTTLFCGIILCLLALTVPARSSKKGNPKNHPPVSKNIDKLIKTKFKNVEFGFNKSSVADAYYDELDKVAKLLIENNASLKVSGHADNIGAYVYNWNLSKTRAQSVKAYLVSKGADESRIASTEFGDTKPIASNETATGRKLNRRVEIQFVE
ncbi:OmpA family protein [Pedobacter sp. HMF7647]|uniref:OmpA family protein n=1 Tax=Hufsiella arboris TaxID=2695275 RepID=A0A7K1YEM4_9SPHI|nr:OmpA family protein [Hufsiella arboris]MXV52469.1 OmpA family protein [Hufsiella arboris]